MRRTEDPRQRCRTNPPGCRRGCLADRCAPKHSADVSTIIRTYMYMQITRQLHHTCTCMCRTCITTSTHQHERSDRRRRTLLLCRLLQCCGLSPSFVEQYMGRCPTTMSQGLSRRLLGRFAPYVIKQRHGSMMRLTTVYVCVMT